MATVDKTIEIIFAGTDKVSGIVSDISGNLDSIGTAMQEVGAPFEEATKKVAILQAAIAGIATAALATAATMDSEGAKMEAALGLPTAEAERFKEIAADAYARGYGDDLADSFDAVIIAQQKFGDNADVDIAQVIENASKLHKVFDIDISASLGATSTLMNNFGLTSEQAFDFIAAGYQKGLDGSGDFIESITEYSTQFANGGADAGAFFSVLETGFQEGVIGTDYAADAFGEFRKRIEDGSKTTRESLELIGIDPDLLQANLNSGVVTVNDAFGIIIKKLNETNDSAIVMQAGAGLIGTRFEDLGTKASLALDTTKTKMEDLEGLVKDIDVEDFGTSLTRAWRSAVNELINHPMWDDLQDSITDTATDVSESFIAAFADYDFTNLIDSFTELAQELGVVFLENEIDLTTVEGMKNAIDLVVNSLISLINVTTGQVEALKPVIQVILELTKTFNNLDSDTKELIGNVLIIGTTFATLGTIVSAGGAVYTGLASLVTLMTGPVGLVVAAGAVAGAVAVMWDGWEDPPTDPFIEQQKLIDEFRDSIDKFPDAIDMKLDLAIAEGADVDTIMSIINEGLLEQDYNSNVLFSQEGLEELVSDTEEATEDKSLTINIDGVDVALADTLAINKAFADLEDKSIKISVDTDELTQATQDLTYWVEDEAGGKKAVTIVVPVDTIDKAKEAIDTIPTEKLLEIELQGDIDTEIARIKATADTAQEAFQYKAEVDIAEVEAQVAIIESAYASIDTSIASTGEGIRSALTAAQGASSQLEQFRAERVLEKELTLRQQSFDLQEKLTNAEIASLEAKTKALEEGDSLITIDSTGLEPALEMVMWQILEKVQVRATAEASEFLLGL